MDTLFIKFQMFKNNGSFRSPASEPAGILVQYRCLGNKVFQKARPHCPRDFSHKYTAVFPQAEIKRSSSLIIRLQISDENLPQALTLRVVFLFFFSLMPTITYIRISNETSVTLSPASGKHTDFTGAKAATSHSNLGNITLCKLILPQTLTFCLAL